MCADPVVVGMWTPRSPWPVRTVNKSSIVNRKSNALHAYSPPFVRITMTPHVAPLYFCRK